MNKLLILAAAQCLLAVTTVCTPLGAQPAVAAAGTAAPATAGLQAGPMVGYSEMREVLLWAQTTAAANVHFVYWDTAAPAVRRRTAGETTRAEDAFTTRQVASLLEPARGYAYELWIDGVPVSVAHPLRFQTQSLWQWRTDPPPFRIAVGSCFYVNEAAYDRPGAPYGGDYHIITAIAHARPDAMLWLGDNTYYREVDWYARSGMLHRYTHTRSLPELQPLLGSTHHYAIWDDHDFGPNDSDRSWSRKETALDVFRLFWGNPAYGVGGRAGVTTMFQWGDVEFFLLDNRYDRTPNLRRAPDNTVLGAEQFQWLIDALISSRAPFKFVAIGGQVLNPRAEHETYANVSPAERQRLIDAITAQNIPGVIFLTGDRHLTELTRIDRSGDYPLYDLTVSPLTAGPFATGTANPASVPGTLVTQRNFALLDFSGPRQDRVVRISIRDPAGTELWSRSIRAAELRRP
jgi:alkaline phosphatase D